jgi:hypothetical protein
MRGTVGGVHMPASQSKRKFAKAVDEEHPSGSAPETGDTSKPVEPVVAPEFVRYGRGRPRKGEKRPKVRGRQNNAPSLIDRILLITTMCCANDTY